MLGLQSSLIRPTIRTFLVSRPLIFPSIRFKIQILPLESPYRFRIFAADGSNNNNTDPIPKEAIEKEQGQQQQQNGFSNGDGSGGVGGGGSGGGGEGGDVGIYRVLMLIYKLGNLLNPDPDPNNIVAVGLTGVLPWASVRLLELTYLMSLAIILSALKYSFIAALLTFTTIISIIIIILL